MVKVQCQEYGTTGMRDSVIANEAIADGRVTIDRVHRKLKGWMHDPYDPALDQGFHWNLSEAPEYDVRFPDHPLSRLRPVLAHLELTLRITKEVKEAPPYIFAG